jgi:hypothetical protein
VKILTLETQPVTCRGCGAVHWPAQTIEITLSDAEAETIGDPEKGNLMIGADGQMWQFVDAKDKIILKGVLAKPMVRTAVVVDS